MAKNEYLAALGKIPDSRKNDIIRAVNNNIPKDKAGLKTAVEKVFYDNLVAEADAHVKKYGKRPVFAMCEIESDDPRLDIYND